MSESILNVMSFSEYQKHINFIIEYFEKEGLTIKQGLLVVIMLKKFVEEETGERIWLIEK